MKSRSLPFLPAADFFVPLRSNRLQIIPNLIDDNALFDETQVGFGLKTNSKGKTTKILFF